MGSPSARLDRCAPQAGQGWWFEASMLYLRVTTPQPSSGPPELLTMRILPREAAASVEVNGVRLPPSEEITLLLRCSHGTDALGELMYVSTDTVRTNATLQFQILDRATLLLSGSLAKATSLRPKARWSLTSTCDAAALQRSGVAMEICVVGRCLGQPMILTHTVSLQRRPHFAIPKHQPAHTIRMASLDEGGEVLPLFDAAKRSHENSTSKVMFVKCGSSSLGMRDTDQEERWYKRGISTGIKLGLGIGIGMCIGVGIGLGLIIHKVRTTTNSLKRITL